MIVAAPTRIDYEHHSGISGCSRSIQNAGFEHAY